MTVYKRKTFEINFYTFVAPLPPPKESFFLIMKSSPASDDQTQINVAFSHLAICDDSNGRITKWYIIVSKGSGKKGVSFLFT